LKEAGFSHWRGMRGDGNCYWRSAIFGFIEFLVISGNKEGLENLCYWVEKDSHYYNMNGEHFYGQYMFENTTQLKEAILVNLKSLLSMMSQ
jgi:hypothetical protein